MTQAQKAIIAFFIIPLVAVIILSVFSPSVYGPMPTAGTYTGQAFLMGLAAISILAALVMLIIQAWKVKS